jgi:hypothetical protein
MGRRRCEAPSSPHAFSGKDQTDANLIVTRRSGRTKLHFLNPVPIRQIHDRWIKKYRARQASALVDLKQELEEK